MEAEAKEQQVAVHHDEAAAPAKDGSVHDSEAAKHHDHAKNVSRTGHESVEVTWKTWFVIFVCSS